MVCRHPNGGSSCTSTGADPKSGRGGAYSRRESGRSSQGELKRPDEASDTVTKARAGTPPEGDEVGVDDFTDDERDFGEEQGGSEGMQDDAERMGERRSDGGGEGDMGDQSQDAMDERGQGGEYERSDEYDESDEYDR
jgi:hypothetical protein